MNIQRLEMMKQMLGRVVAGSWTPVQTLPSTDRIPTPFPAITIDNFDLSSWVEKKSPVNNTCGFVACAVGHACFDEEFRKLGLKFDGHIPQFDGYESWYAVHALFDVTHQTASNLFGSRGYNTKVKSTVAHLPSKIREAQMVHDRISILIDLADEDEFNAAVSRGNA